MLDSSFQFLSIIFDGMKALAVFFLGLIGWHIRTQSKRLADLERDTITRTELTQSVEKVHDDIRHGFDEIKKDIRGVHSRIDNINHRGK